MLPLSSILTMTNHSIRRNGAVVVVLWLSLLLHLNNAFSIHAPWRNSRCSSSLCSSNNTPEKGTRAGSSGYSVLRQPVQWDPTEDPTFEVPSSLKNDEKTNSILDETWLTQQRQPRATETRKPQPKHQQELENRIQHESPQELDLFQRTLDTLDYPIVLDALQESCTTVPARRIVSEAMHSMTPKKKKRFPKEFMAAYQPLTADSLQGIQQRYGAVEEMQRLLDDDEYETGLVVSSPLKQQDAHWRNRKGYKVPLGPPPLSGMTFNLNDILSTKEQVLEGPELLEIVTMLDVLEDISLWSHGLSK